LNYTILFLAGFTRRRGVTETQRMVWVLSRPTCSLVNKVMQDLTGYVRNICEQHMDYESSEVERDNKDTQKVIVYIENGSPFSGEPNTLRSIATGIK
jgi:hypothetical protein